MGGHAIMNQPNKKSKKVYCFKDNILVATYDGLSIDARATGVRVQNVYKACKGYKTTLSGYTFSYTQL